MSESVLLIIEVILLLVGIAGCILPGLPGIPIAYLALLIQHFSKNQHNYPIWLLFFIGLIVVLIIAMQYIIPPWTSKKFGASKFAVWGSIIGLLIGLLFGGPFGIFLGAFGGAVLGELFLARKTFEESMKAGLGAFIGVLASTFVELIFTLGIVFVFVLSLF